MPNRYLKKRLRLVNPRLVVRLSFLLENSQFLTCVRSLGFWKLRSFFFRVIVRGLWSTLRVEGDSSCSWFYSQAASPVDAVQAKHSSMIFGPGTDDTIELGSPGLYSIFSCFRRPTTQSIPSSWPIRIKLEISAQGSWSCIIRWIASGMHLCTCNNHVKIWLSWSSRPDSARGRNIDLALRRPRHCRLELKALVCHPVCSFWASVWFYTC